MGQTALVILVPEAEDVVAGLRDAHDPAAALGVPGTIGRSWPLGADAPA